VTILVVDDQSDSRALLTAILASEGYDVRPADGGRLALAFVVVERPELILLDLRMPGMDGFEVCRRLKENAETRDIPLMFISASGDVQERIEGLRLGAVDFVTKPFQREELLARVRTHLELGRLRAHLEQRVAERTAELRESEQRFRTMADAAPVLIWVSDAGRQFTFFNRTWREFAGRTTEGNLGKAWATRVHADDLDRWSETYARSFDARETFNLEYRLLRADGAYRWVLDTGVPRFSPDGVFEGYIGSGIDITELKRSQEEALARQKLESLGVMAGGIAHDFNNLLGSIMAESELLRDELEDNPAAQLGAKRIGDVAMRAAEIVRQLMVYAGRDSAEFEQVDLAGIVREMLQLMRVSISKNAALNVDLPERLPVIRANPAQIRQVVMNLITNASEALGGREGAVTVALMQVHTSGEPGYLRLEISDTGCGMREEVRAGIFDPFFTTKGAGRGLGLASVQGIIRSHGGAISVASAPGQGSSFEILLPCSAQAKGTAHDDGTAHSANAEMSFTGTLLLIDDEEALLFAVAKMLRKKGFSVLEARNGREGIDLFQAHAGNVRAVLLDITLPGISSGEVLEELRRIDPDVNVILSSAYGLDKASAALREAERLPYVRKPYQHAALVDLIRRTCSDRKRGDGKAERRSA
jgi:two-component system, cell cycle sensor histidine kinase and response regulator CckA